MVDTEGEGVIDATGERDGDREGVGLWDQEPDVDRDVADGLRVARGVRDAVAVAVLRGEAEGVRVLMVADSERVEGERERERGDRVMVRLVVTEEQVGVTEAVMSDGEGLGVRVVAVVEAVAVWVEEPVGVTT